MAPQMTKVRLETTDDFVEAHNALEGHAFTCYEKFDATYRQHRAEGYSWATSYLRAVRAHDQAVEWTTRNVGLD